ncbi:hypothetical protein QT381_11200 [Galbitalea sp. SE-J8]|uniref:hypothetical protein n=1 Tax=Galbitalea sp. SE-J8 TaxID=3054952 RepID=UPI00259D201D|nr:hypothetical protein [Galbitalea sp. SE-J8]MDM4763575.1 hypothetical protein [Galbitalea sp. SE-J8]
MAVGARGALAPRRSRRCLMIASCSPGAGSTEERPTALPTVAQIDPAVLAADDDCDPTRMSKEQFAAIDDGEISYDDYLPGFQRMATCMEADGYTLVHEGENNEIVDTSIPDAAFPSYQECYAREFVEVDKTWQIYRENFGPPAHALSECLTERGEKPALTYLEKYQQFAALGLDPQKDCWDVKLRG